MNAYKLCYVVFGTLALAIVGLDLFAYDTLGGNLFFPIHAISVTATYLLTILCSKISHYFGDEKTDFSGVLIVNIANLIPLINFVALLVILTSAISMIISFIENSGKFTFKP